MTLVVIGIGVAAVAAVLGWFAGLARLRPAGASTISGITWALNLAAAVLFVVAGSLVLAGADDGSADAAGPIGASGAQVVQGTLVSTTTLRLDRLSALFLVISFGVAVPVLLSAASRGMVRRPRLAAGIALVLLATAVVVTAGDLFTLLLGWEGLGFAFYLVVGYDRDRRGRAWAAVLTGGFSGFSGAAILLAGSLLFAYSHTLDLAGIAAGSPRLIRDTAYVLFIVGFAVKVGLMPLHIWLPRGYAAAPGPARALLAGSAVNVGFYALWRTLDILGTPPAWLACAVLVVGGLTALLGISHAAVNADLASLVSWSSVENAGLIVTAYGVGLVGAIAHEPALVAAGILAATAQVCAHALGKSLLFVSAAAIEDAYLTTDLDRLRAIARRLPFSGTGLVIGSLTLAGVPLTAGFASEWFILEALMQQFRVDDLPLNLSLAVAGVLVALTIGVATIAFVRLIALTAFGHAGEDIPQERRVYERRLTHRGGIVLLVAGCLGTAVVAPLQVRMIAAGILPITDDVSKAVTGTWILQPVYSGFSALSPSWLWIMIPAYVLLVGILAFALSGRRFLRVRRVPPWRSASPGVINGRGYTSFAFANPMRKVLAAILMTRGELRREEIATGGETGGEQRGPAGVRLGYTIDVVDVVERYLYRPLIPLGMRIVRTAQRLQSGRLDAYIAYMLIALLAILAVVTSMAVNR
ncbi:proton-conducting transporter membrane subunit [Humibacter albus]|uniref:proton-conducting transporter transmembrane domain-containing protein n=1 Tax=Humibacter albus TaxID=427754 RepID=UPI0003FC38F5|nr:proton-conducting transporter membrane subunit [Humibacter albus]